MAPPNTTPAAAPSAALDAPVPRFIPTSDGTPTSVRETLLQLFKSGKIAEYFETELSDHEFSEIIGIRRQEVCFTPELVAELIQLFRHNMLPTLRKAFGIPESKTDQEILDKIDTYVWTPEKLRSVSTVLDAISKTNSKWKKAANQLLSLDKTPLRHLFTNGKTLVRPAMAVSAAGEPEVVDRGFSCLVCLEDVAVSGSRFASSCGHGLLCSSCTERLPGKCPCCRKETRYQTLYIQ